MEDTPQHTQYDATSVTGMCLSVRSLELSVERVTEHINAALREARLGVIFTSFSVVLNF